MIQMNIQPEGQGPIMDENFDDAAFLEAERQRLEEEAFLAEAQ